MLIGIDPGVVTGLAIATDRGQLVEVTSCGIVCAMDRVETQRCDSGALVLFEDARMRSWFGRTGREVLQGAGSIKRDSAIWQEFLEARGIPYRALKPQKGGTKWTAAQFKNLTRWPGRTNEHARDAAMLVYGVSIEKARRMI